MFKQLLLLVTAIGVVCGQECPVFSALQNDVSLLNQLNGTFYKIFNIGTVNVADCQKQTFTNGPNNDLSGYFQSSDWCLRLDNCDTSNSTYYQCDLTPVTTDLVTLPSTQRNSIKLVQRIGAANNFCLLYSYCRIGEEGAYVLCREPPVLLPLLLLEVNNLLITLLGLILPAPITKTVRQTGCTFSNCPP